MAVPAVGAAGAPTPVQEFWAKESSFLWALQGSGSLVWKQLSERQSIMAEARDLMGIWKWKRSPSGHLLSSWRRPPGSLRDARWGKQCCLEMGSRQQFITSGERGALMVGGTSPEFTVAPPAGCTHRRGTHRQVPVDCLEPARQACGCMWVHAVAPAAVVRRTPTHLTLPSNPHPLHVILVQLRHLPSAPASSGTSRPARGCSCCRRSSGSPRKAPSWAQLSSAPRSMARMTTDTPTIHRGGGRAAPPLLTGEGGHRGRGPEGGAHSLGAPSLPPPMHVCMHVRTSMCKGMHKMRACAPARAQTHTEGDLS